MTKSSQDCKVRETLNDSQFKGNRRFSFGFAMNIGKIFINL